MSKPLDLFRSLVRNAADLATSSVEKLGPVARVREALDDLVHERIHIKQGRLTSAIAHLPGVESAQVSARKGSLFVDVTYERGDHLQAVFTPEWVRFAPRGAKEIAFRVEPELQAGSHRVIDIASAIGGTIALAIWPIVRDASQRDVSGAIVDRDGPTRLCVDLRTVPAVRAFEQRGQAAMLLEVLELGALEVVPGSLELTLVMPRLAP